MSLNKIEVVCIYELYPGLHPNRQIVIDIAIDDWQQVAVGDYLECNSTWWRIFEKAKTRPQGKSENTTGAIALECICGNEIILEGQFLIKSNANVMR